VVTKILIICLRTRTATATYISQNYISAEDGAKIKMHACWESRPSVFWASQCATSIVIVSCLRISTLLQCATSIVIVSCQRISTLSQCGGLPTPMNILALSGSYRQSLPCWIGQSVGVRQERNPTGLKVVKWHPRNLSCNTARGLSTSWNLHGNCSTHVRMTAHQHVWRWKLDDLHRVAAATAATDNDDILRF
jgi:hypothetical protein